MCIFVLLLLLVCSRAGVMKGLIFTANYIKLFQWFFINCSLSLTISYTNIGGNKYHTKKYQVTSARAGCDQSSEQRFNGFNRLDSQSKGINHGTLSPLLIFGQRTQCSPRSLVNQSAMLKEKSAQGCKARHIAITNCPFGFAFNHLPRCGQLLRQKHRNNFTWRLYASFS